MTSQFWFPEMTVSGVLLQLWVAPAWVSDLKCTQMHVEMGIPMTDSGREIGQGREDIQLTR